MLIQTAKQLESFCATLQQSTAVFVDTEFVGEGRYYPEVGAIQVADAAQAALIDPLAIADLAPLWGILRNPAIEKVFHAAGQDLAIFSRALGAPVAPVFDTQIAAALLGYDEQISFARLVERAVGKRLQKTHAFTDWLQRPLSAGQIEYALDDVRYLVPAYTHLVHELDARRRLEWAREEFTRLEDPERFAPVDPREVYLRFRGVDRMHGKALAILRELAAWREETARALNIPTSRIARDEVLAELAHRPRETTKELRTLRGMLPQQVDRFGQAMIEVAHRQVPVPPPMPERPSTLPAGLEPTVDFLTLCLRSLAEELSLSPGLVATRGDLTALVVAGEEADTPLLRGWRRVAIGEALLATLEGRATARILPGSRRVHLDWTDIPRPLPEKRRHR